MPTPEQYKTAAEGWRAGFIFAVVIALVVVAGAYFIGRADGGRAEMLAARAARDLQQQINTAAQTAVNEAMERAR